MNTTRNIEPNEKKTEVLVPRNQLKVLKLRFGRAGLRYVNPFGHVFVENVDLGQRNVTRLEQVEHRFRDSHADLIVKLRPVFTQADTIAIADRRNIPVDAIYVESFDPDSPEPFAAIGTGGAIRGIPISEVDASVQLLRMSAEFTIDRTIQTKHVMQALAIATNGEVHEDQRVVNLPIPDFNVIRVNGAEVVRAVLAVRDAFQRDLESLRSDPSIIQAGLLCEVQGAIKKIADTTFDRTLDDQKPGLIGVLTMTTDPLLVDVKTKLIDIGETILKIPEVQSVLEVFRVQE